MCTKIQPQDLDSKVMMYLKLRDQGCNKRQARLFCKKNVCQIDTTQKYTGPAGHKTLQVVQNNNIAHKGWQPAQLTKYQLGNNYKSVRDLEDVPTHAEQAILNQYKQFESGKSQVLLQKMLAVQNYTTSIQGPDLNAEGSSAFCNKIRRISTELRESYQQPTTYIKLGDTRYFELAKIVGRNGSINDSPFLTGIPQFQFGPFDNVLPDVRAGKLKQKLRNKNIVNPIKFTQTNLESLETESRLIMALQTSPGLSDVIDSTKKKPTPPQAILDLLKKQTQKTDLAEEFNQTQYLFTHGKKAIQLQKITQTDKQLNLYIQQFYELSNQKTVTATNSCRSVMPQISKVISES